MTIIDRAKAFVNHLRHPPDPAICPHCGYRYTKRHGTYRVTVRDLGGVRSEACQRYYCHRCRKTYTPEDPHRARYQRYTRRVQRKALDMRLHLEVSLRRVAEWLRAEITPTSGRARIWDPQQPDQQPPHAQARLHHTSVWRWQRRASRRWRQQQQTAPAVWAGVVWAGRLVGDATGILVRGVQTTLHLIALAGSGVIVAMQLLQVETRAALRRAFQQALLALGARWSEWTDLMSDGAAVYAELLRWDAPHVRAHRCLSHLWRNLGGRLQQYKAAQGEEAAAALRIALHLVWDAVDLAEARDALRGVAELWAEDVAVQEIVAWMQPTLAAVMAPTALEGMVRTTNDAELRFERYKRRYRAMHSGFMSGEGAERWHDLWMVYANWEPTQVRHERKRQYRQPPGQALLARGALEVEGTCWLDALAV
jgi:Transposase, Mutator family